MVDRLERLLNLTATLLDTRRPLTLDELSERVEPRYPDEKGARRRQFERDKETLRELGIPIRVETVDGFGAEQAYRIHPDDYYLPELALTDAELAALHVAVTAVRLEGDAGREGLAKLGGLTGEGADAPVAELGVTPGLGRAVRRGEPPRHREVLVPGIAPAARPLRRGAPLRPLVRRGPRPGPRRAPGVPGRPDRRRPRDRPRRRVHPARGRRPAPTSSAPTR